MKNFIDSYMVMLVFCSIGLMITLMAVHSFYTNPIVSQIGLEARIVCLKDRCVIEEHNCPLCQERIESWGIITNSNKFIGERYFYDFFSSYDYYIECQNKLVALKSLFWSGILSIVIGLIFGAYILNLQIRRK